METMFEILCPERRVADRRSERTDGRRSTDTAKRVMGTVISAQWMDIETRMAMVEAIQGVMNDH